MSEAVVIKVKERSDMSKSARKVFQNDGYLLGNISVKGTESVAIAVKKDELRKALSTHGKNTVLSLDISDDRKFTAMVTKFQVKPLSGEFCHVDFQSVSLTQVVKSNVIISIIGDSLLEAKRLLVNKQMDEITVSGLPQDIPESFEIDVSGLVAGDHVKIGDIKFPSGITPELDADHTILTIGEPKAHDIPADAVETPVV